MGIEIGDRVTVGRRSQIFRVVEVSGGEAVLVPVPGPGSPSAVSLSQCASVADQIAAALRAGRRSWRSLPISGDVDLGRVAEAFGFRGGNWVRSDSEEKIRTQLKRSGVRLRVRRGLKETGELTLLGSPASPREARDRNQQFDDVELPEIHWPEALGLAPMEVLPFLDSLGGSQAVLCILELGSPPDQSSREVSGWSTIMSTAHTAAQAFRGPEATPGQARFVAAPALSRWLSGSAIGEDMIAGSRSGELTLTAVQSLLEIDSLALRGRWPGPIYTFRYGAVLRQDSGKLPKTVLESLMTVLGIVAGYGPPGLESSELDWVSGAHDMVRAGEHLRAGASIALNRSLASASNFRGSNEGGLALQLKLVLWRWAAGFGGEPRFEESSVDEHGNPRRVDVRAGHWVGEVETLIKSGPWEHFFFLKAIRRLQGLKSHEHLILLVPGDAVLWAGPRLADLAHALGQKGSIVIPSSGRLHDDKPRLLRIKGTPLSEWATGDRAPCPPNPWSSFPDEDRPQRSASLTLADVAGYDTLKRAGRDLADAYGRSGGALTGGVLFYGPPGCGKSYFVRALVGEAGLNARFLGPADLRGPYIGWGQVYVREQFHWLRGDRRRILVIDEFDAVARKRRSVGMHSDEKADVNELLVQLDEATRAGSLLFATTNFIGSLDDAVIRGGRFSEFVAVGPPEPADAGPILGYQLRVLAARLATNSVSTMEVPRDDDLVSLLSEPGMLTRGGDCLASGDLDSAARRVWRRAIARESSSVSVDDVIIAVREQRASISASVLSRFMRDLKRYGSVGCAFG